MEIIDNYHISYITSLSREVSSSELLGMKLGERCERVPNSTQNIDCLHRGGMPL